MLSESTVLRGFSQDVDQSHLAWHRDREDRKIIVVEGRGWKFQRDNHLPESISAGDTISISAGEYHRLLKGDTDLIVTIVKEEKKKLTKKQMKIARAAPPEDEITGADFKALNKDVDEVVSYAAGLQELEDLDEKKKRKRKKKKKTDFHKGGEASYRKGRSSKQLSKQISLTRDYNSATTEKQKQKIRDKIDRAREKERTSESKSIDRDELLEYIEEIVEEQKLYEALDEVAAIEEEKEFLALHELEDLDEKKKRKKKKRKKKKKSGSRTLSKAVKKSLDKKADRRCLTRGSVYAEFRAGLGAYYSSGSRKGMSAHQWAHARVNSANPSKKWAKVKKRKKCPKKKK